ncbi:Fic family protein [Paenibacillus alvei]|uniref:Fic/DOC family protein n=1 Tax=Paenibacillus alvei TaxID=44250 RepID=UPI0002887861|nr:Fic family protein [Paenibacillus alvei]EJW13887.1 hypothetical protein PAV_109p01180 [Paenibacillus alvei DSM 29]MCY9540494.1 Fic family protein [Paenibacillus alvei]MCY9708302.1 Fic family protein [Paenibacillus alvei]MCY9733010.1 Fic family protein [Paenibacillus alvei]MCY9755223.1 Fic family protein [Paenibacillus alvei]
MNQYVYPGTDILRNKADIRDQEMLQIFERNNTMVRAIQLRENTIKGNFDLDHLKAIHKHLFQDVYPWAGELRATNIRKTEWFAEYRTLDSMSFNTFANLKQDKYLKGLDQDMFAKKAAAYYSDINYLHPFREGNGRSIREFFSQLAKNAGHELNWSRVPKEEYMEAVITTMHDPSKIEGLTDVFVRCMKKEDAQETEKWVVPKQEMQLKDVLKRAEGMPMGDSDISSQMLIQNVEKFRIKQDGNKETIQFQLSGEKDIRSVPLEKVPYLNRETKNEWLDLAAGAKNVQINRGMDMGM